MSSTRTAVAIILVAGALAGCSSARSALGVAKVTPDEFRIVTKAPLVIPPDYALRPPTPGEPRPAELLPDSAARQAFSSQRAAATRSAGEQILVAKAGAERADPLARYVVDDEFGDLAYKDKSFADRVMFWRKDDPAQQGAVEGATDAATEAERIKNLTGGKDIVIARQKPRFKLPGL